MISVLLVELPGSCFFRLEDIQRSFKTSKSHLNAFGYFKSCVADLDLAILKVALLT